MEFLENVLKALFIFAMVLLMAAPIVAEYYSFRGDNEKKITYKRFRMVVYTGVYVIAVTVALFLLKELVLGLESLAVIQWIVARLALTGKVIYLGKVLVAILLNFAIGVLYCVFSRFVRIGMKKRSLIAPKKKNGEFSWSQKLERKIIRFFYKEIWFFVAKILKYLSIALSVIYAFLFIVFQIPAVYMADWIPYDAISVVFSASYLYPVITLLALWEMYFFLSGIELLEKECPELLQELTGEVTTDKVDLKAVDEEVRKQFKDYYVCDVELSQTVQAEVAATDHHEITKFIGQAVENDRRNPQKNKEVYLNCLDGIVDSDDSVLINGSFFSEFSMYFLRYLSVVMARGDNVVFVCNSDAQIDETYRYLKQALSEMTSLYCSGFQNGAVNMDDPIWRIVKINGETDVLEEASVDDNSILVTSLSYLCSTDFERQHSNFIHLLDTIVFVDALKTVNTFNRQLAMLNTRLKHITRSNALLSRNGSINKDYAVRYMSRQVRYVCFNDNRVPGLDKVLKNLLAVDMKTVDAMHYNTATAVRCYRYEGSLNDEGRREAPQFFDVEEQIGALVNMAVLCLAKGASNVTIFAEDNLPYAAIAESISANMGRVAIKVDGNKIRLNSHFYNPDDYSVMIVMDSGDNLPTTLRRYLSMVPDKPALVLIFSRPYMMRDYYLQNLSTLWAGAQQERIPVEEGSRKDVAQRILVKANAGGISEKEILQLAGGVEAFGKFAKSNDVAGILRAVLEVYGYSQSETLDLYQYFEYSTTRDFDENGVFCSENKVLLRNQGKLFDMINGRDMVVMVANDRQTVLPMPRKRLTQNYIAGQNLLYNGNVYHINSIDTATGRLFTRLAVAGKNEEAFQYLQVREYRVERSGQKAKFVKPTKHTMPNLADKDIRVDDVYVSVFRAPMEVLTKGYYELDPNSLALNGVDALYHSISDAGNDDLAKQSYRRYGELTEATYSSDSVMKQANLVADEKGALMMSVRLCGQFGPDVNKTMALAAAMLGEQIRTMFPSVADSVVVCPVLRSPFEDDEAKRVLHRLPSLTIIGEQEGEDNAFELLIIEDCATDLGVVSVLMSDGDNVIRTLFRPVFEYLKWYQEADRKSDYLYYGLDHEPVCFDFGALHQLATLLGDSKNDLKFVDLSTVMEYAVCDFCGKRYAKSDALNVLEDGRKMCAECAQNLVGNNKKALKAHLDRAKIFLESTYGITLDDEYEFCFESTVKIVNTLKQNKNIIRRGTDAPLKSYIDDKKRVHIEYSVPSATLSELLVRELTHIWQIQHLPTLSEDLAEGHLALVGIQYLRFLNQPALVWARTSYYECNGGTSGQGYRKLVRELLANPQFRNNPFRYLLERTEGAVEDDIVPPQPQPIEEGMFGLPYTPQQPDRVTDGNLTYFYYGRLSETAKKVYDILLPAIQRHTDSVTVEGVDAETIANVSLAIHYDHPELFWYKTVGIMDSFVKLYYGASPEETAVLQRRIDEVVPQYLADVTDTMSAYDAALRIHAKVIASVDYDSIGLKAEDEAGGPSMEKIDYLRTICGVFLEGKAVCEGYARAMQYLLQKCGIECAEAAGYIRKENGDRDGAHAWNILKVDGDYYYLDTTWDDSSNTIQKVKTLDMGFDYFCITEDELTRTRDLELCPTDMPPCIATRANYFYHNDLVLDSYDLKKIKTIAQNAARNQTKSFTVKCKSKPLFEQTLSQLCAVADDCGEVLKAAAKVDKKILTTGYNYSYDTNIWTVTVKFKYK